MISRRKFVGGVAGAAISHKLWKPTGVHVGVHRHGNYIDICSPYFVFRLDVTNGLRAVFWRNKITNIELRLGSRLEMEFDIGLPGTSQSTEGMPGDSLLSPNMSVVASPAQTGRGFTGKAVFRLATDARESCAATATVTYTWDAQSPVLRKQVVIHNVGGETWDRLLNIRLGSYTAGAGETGDPDYPVRITETPWGSTKWIQWPDPAGRTRGFPAYIDWQFFVGLAHPSGFALQENSRTVLLQYPGVKLAAGASFHCMDTVYGVSAAGKAREAFRMYLQSQMRRIRRKHDRPYAILSSFGGNPTGDKWENADYLEDNLSKVAEGQHNSGLHWDLYSIDFWHDPFGNLKTPDKKRFPAGFRPILEKLAQLNTKPGLWIDSGGFTAPPVVGFPIWTCGRNPAMKNATTLSDNHGALCRATYPANQFYIDGFIFQCKNNRIRMIAFDNCGWPECFLDPTCDNPRHTHLPGKLYSTEAIQNAIIDFFQKLDAACPDVFIKLFWGYRSPWWLLHADTMFDLGLRIEAATPSDVPTLFLRDSVTRVLDRARWMAKDTPWLGADSLGIWLADWPWDMYQGEAKWQNGVVMDICRGQMLPQLWTNTSYLDPVGRTQMATFIELVKARPACFANSRFIIGNPWKNEPYGYACPDGNRAFIAINNGVWHDSTIPLELNDQWGLPAHGKWDIYRWYPKPARLTAAARKPILTMGPLETVLLEIVPQGAAPSLTRKWQRSEMSRVAGPRSFDIPLDVGKGTVKHTPQGVARDYRIGVQLPASDHNACLAVTAEFFKDGQPFLTLWNPNVLIMHGNSNGKLIEFSPTINPSVGTWYPSCWQTWRLNIPANSTLPMLELNIKSSLPLNVDIRWRGYLIPLELT